MTAERTDLSASHPCLTALDYFTGDKIRTIVKHCHKYSAQVTFLGRKTSNIFWRQNLFRFDEKLLIVLQDFFLQTQFNFKNKIANARFRNCTHDR